MNALIEETLNKIAKNVLHLDTLETRKSDSLDFREQAVWNIKQALTDAYIAGQGSVILGFKKKEED